MTDIAQYIESNLTIGQGRDAGKPFVLLPWQRRFLRGAFAVEGDACLSMARANGKSTFIAAIARCLLTPDAPLHSPMVDNAIVAASFAQGGIIFRHLLHFLRPELDKGGTRVWRKVDSSNMMLIEHKPSGARIQVLGHKPETMHGLAPRLLLLDELAQWQHTQVEASLAALTTSMGKIPDAKLLAIGTRPARTSHPFQRMLEGGADFAMSYQARKTDPPFQRRTWKRANPSLDAMPDLEAAIRREAEQARRDPSLLNQFEALRLNLGVSETQVATLLDADTWARLEQLPDAARDGEYILGLDLGANQAMTAAAGYWPDTGRLECFAVFPERPSLAERGLKDGVGSLYGRMEARGELFQAGDRLPDYRFLLRRVLAEWGRPVSIASDRYKKFDLLQELDACGFPMVDIAWRGQGMLDGGTDVRAFRAACLTNEVRPPVSLLLRAAMSEARCRIDDSGNTKLLKVHEGSGSGFQPRDDAAAASIMAIAEGVRYRALTAARPAVRFNIL